MKPLPSMLHLVYTTVRGHLYPVKRFFVYTDMLRFHPDLASDVYRFTDSHMMLMIPRSHLNRDLRNSVILGYCRKLESVPTMAHSL
jgi:hypothetical protein